MLCWNVYMSDMNSGEIKMFNVFNHWAFYNDCLKAKKRFREDREGFAEEVRKCLMYYFWSKCEYEIILDHWPDGEWSELRRKMTIGEMLDMYRAAGIDVQSWRINDAVMDRKVDLRLYPEWIKYKQRKIDIYDQVMNNWDIFIDYLWNNRKELRVRK